MAPDFEYFLRLRAYGSYGHTWAGIFWFDLPMSLLIAALFHGLVKRPLVRSLPFFLRSRLGQLAEKPWPLRQLWSKRVILGILIGSLSHILSDAFTHSDTPITIQLAWLQPRIGSMPLYRWLQYISSVIGLVAIAWVIWKLPVRARLVKATSKIKHAFWTLNGVLTTTFWALFMLINDKDERLLIISVIVTGISAICLSQVLTSVIMQRFFQPSEYARAARALKRQIAHELAQKQLQ
jgi:membrane-bound metal-dependent hydrolase YbcI (DUF457 family)